MASSCEQHGAERLPTGFYGRNRILASSAVRPRRFRARLFGSFAFASLFVAGLGIFGQLAMSTARRTREVGIRMTCGATPGSIARLILGEQPMGSFVLAAAGTLVPALRASRIDPTEALRNE